MAKDMKSTYFPSAQKQKFIGLKIVNPKIVGSSSSTRDTSVDQKHPSRLTKSIDCLSIIVSYLDKIDIVGLQTLNRLFYNKIIPRVSERQNLTYKTFYPNTYTRTNRFYDIKNGELCFLDSGRFKMVKYGNTLKKLDYYIKMENRRASKQLDNKDYYVQVIPMSSS